MLASSADPAMSTVNPISPSLDFRIPESGLHPRRPEDATIVLLPEFGGHKPFPSEQREV
jgi:hypothetical protein